jgi:type IV pilus assembly protein PilV
MKEHHQEKGYSLLEVLIALVVLAIGLLGLAGLQMQGLKDNHSSSLRSQATYLASDILDRMQANRAQALGTTNNYNNGFGAVTGKSGMVQTDLTQWKSALNATLPSGDGSVQVTDGTVTVLIRWQDVSADGNATQFRTDSRL